MSLIWPFFAFWAGAWHSDVSTSKVHAAKGKKESKHILRWMFLLRLSTETAAKLPFAIGGWVGHELFMYVLVDLGLFQPSHYWGE